MGSGKILSRSSNVRRLSVYPSVRLSVESMINLERDLRGTKFGHNICLVLEQFSIENRQNRLINNLAN